MNVFLKFHILTNIGLRHTSKGLLDSYLKCNHFREIVFDQALGNKTHHKTTAVVLLGISFKYFFTWIQRFLPFVAEVWRKNSKSLCIRPNMAKLGLNLNLDFEKILFNQYFFWKQYRGSWLKILLFIPDFKQILLQSSKILIAWFV